MTKIASNETFFITGGAGFIGANLIHALLSKNHRVHLLLKPSTNLWRVTQLLNNKNLTLHFIDINDAQSLASTIQTIQPTIMYHLATHGATHSENDPQAILATNVLGTLHVLRACANVKYKLFVNISSSSEYGCSNKPMSEDMPVKPNSYYAVSKVAQTFLAKYEAECTHKPIVTIRPFSVYGPYENNLKLFPTLFNAILKNKPIHLTDQKSAHDFMYIDDLVSGLLQVDALANQGGEVLNFGTGTQVTLEEVALIIQKITKKSIAIEWVAASAHRWDTHHWVADTTKIKKVMPWHPLPFHKGLARYWKWYIANSSLYNQ
jgi:nucleoside-diphosphate-sugar epimerase